MFLGKQGLRQSLTNEVKRNFGANEKIILNRLKSVKNIQKITKAMKLIAATKMRGDLNRLEQGRDFGHNSVDMIFKCDTFMQRKTPPASGNSELIVPLTTDRGLCGGINSGVVRDIKAYVGNQERSELEIFSIGEKGSSALLRPFPDIFTTSISAMAYPVNYVNVMAAAENIAAAGANHDKITIVYNYFNSAISYEIKKLELLPRNRFHEVMKFQKLYNQTRPDKSTSNPAIYELYVSSNLFHALLQNAASEQSARMTAMENASKNAGELIDKLTLEYNKARQARITMELVEIISGASAL